MDLAGSGIGAVAMGILKSDKTRNILMRFFHKVWKCMRLKNVQCIVVNDVDRKQLKFAHDEHKYQYLDVEEVYLSLLSDGEIARLSQLKKMNSRSWIISVKQPCKAILTKVRELWKNEIVILCVSNIELARELHVKDKDIQIYVQDKDYHEEICKRNDETVNAYLTDRLNRHKNSRKVKVEEYKSYDQLVERLSSKFEGLA